MEKTFTRVHSIKDIVIFISLLVLGGILVAVPTSDAVNITGFFLVLAGAILALVLKTGYKDVETNVKYIKKERYFQQAMHAAIADAIASKPDSIDLSQENKGNAIKLDIYFSKASGKAYIQLFEYVPYTYQPCSKMYEYEISKVGKLIK